MKAPHINQPFVSIIMAVYNDAQFLSQAVESIMAQTYSNFEFIIIDDGSNDRSLSELLRFKDSRINILANTENKGLPYSLNKAIVQSTGTYLIRMDSDDIAMKSRVSKLVRFMEANKNIDVSGSWLRTIDNSNKSRCWKLPTKHEEISAQLLFRNTIMHPTVILRKESLVKNKELYDPSFIKSQDYDLWVKLLMAGCNFANINKPLLKYRVSERNKNPENYRRQNADSARVRKKYINWLGISPSANELSLNEYLATLNFRPANANIDDLYMWCRKLILYNEKAARVDSIQFSQTVSRQFTLACLAAPHEHNKLAKKLNSALRKTTKRSRSVDDIKLVLK